MVDAWSTGCNAFQAKAPVPTVTNSIITHAFQVVTPFRQKLLCRQKCLGIGILAIFTGCNAFQAKAPVPTQIVS